MNATAQSAIPHVAAVMVGMDSKKWLGPALASLAHSAAQKESYHLCIYYADNNSADGSAAYVRESFPEVCVIENKANIGFAAANNRVMRDVLGCGANYVFLVNPDTFTPPGLVGQLTEFMEEWRNYGIIGPIQWNYAGHENGAEDCNAWTESALDAGERHGLDRHF
jgi:GT2 family glycosyltransferase